MSTQAKIEVPPSAVMATLEDKVSLEYLIGLAYQKTDHMVNIADVEKVELVKTLAGAIVVFKMKNWQPDFSVNVSDKELETQQTIQSVSSAVTLTPPKSKTDRPTSRVFPGNLPLVINYLKNVNSKVREIAVHYDIIDVEYETESETLVNKNGTYDPKYRIHVKYQDMRGSTKRTTTIYETKEVMDHVHGLANLNGGAAAEEKFLDLCLSYLMKYESIKNIVGSGHRITEAKARQGGTTPYFVEIEFHDPKGPEPIQQNKIAIPITQEDFKTLRTYAEAYTERTKNIKDMKKQNNPTIPIKQECSVGVHEIPRLTPTKHYDAAALRKIAEPTLALKCKCDKGFFCPNILVSVGLGTDYRSWLSKVPNPTKGDVPSHFYLGVPIFGRILYSFRVKHLVSESWSGDRVKKFMAYGITEDETFFYDAPPTSGALGFTLTMMRDTIAYVEQYYDRMLSAWAPMMSSIVQTGVVAPCKGKHHTYGSNKKILDLLKSVGLENDDTKALILSLELYDLCIFCYENATPAFSLLPDLS